MVTLWNEERVVLEPLLSRKMIPIACIT